MDFLNLASSACVRVRSVANPSNFFVLVSSSRLPSSLPDGSFSRWSSSSHIESSFESADVAFVWLNKSQKEWMEVYDTDPLGFSSNSAAVFTASSCCLSCFFELVAALFLLDEAVDFARRFDDVFDFLRVDFTCAVLTLFVWIVWTNMVQKNRKNQSVHHSLRSFSMPSVLPFALVNRCPLEFSLSASALRPSFSIFSPFSSLHSKLSTAKRHCRP